jgi:hypothetical protein
MDKVTPKLLTDSSAEIGKECVLCHQPFKEGDYCCVCPRCKTPHHEHCWVEKEGCSKTGCPYVEITPDSFEKTRLTDDDRAKMYQHPFSAHLPKIIIFLVLCVIVGIGIYPSLVADPKPEISVFVPFHPDTAYLWPIMESMREKYPEYRFIIIEKPVNAQSSSYLEALTISIAGGDAPDIFLLIEKDFLNYARHGSYSDLTVIYSDNPSLLEKIPERYLKTVKVADSYLGVPYPDGIHYLGVYYDTKHLPIVEDLLAQIALSLWP